MSNGIKDENSPSFKFIYTCIYKLLLLWCVDIKSNTCYDFFFFSSTLSFAFSLSASLLLYLVVRSLFIHIHIFLCYSSSTSDVSLSLLLFLILVDDGSVCEAIEHWFLVIFLTVRHERVWLLKSIYKSVWQIAIDIENIILHVNIVSGWASSRRRYVFKSKKLI